MNESEETSKRDSVAREAWIDALCDRYESARKAGQSMSAGEFLRIEGLKPEEFDPQLLKELACLEVAYQSDDATRSFARVDKALSHGSSLETGQVIAGRYTLLEVIGEGGMGTVFRADQTEPVRRKVALKIIRNGKDSRSVLARFDAERQALALMDHPNIARVFDGGTTSAGQPFFAMELVNGVPITDYCDRERLSVRARLELFVSVCQAVQHAHQKGIIHRDLKPGNILVTEVDGRPTPKVIDFGVAKATEQKLTDLSLSETGVIVGTPAYMSPEQADPSSMDIDTRTDVFALGVVLYELLTGSTPIEKGQFKRGAILEMLRMVRDVDPPKPSTKISTADALPNIASNRNVEPAQLKRQLKGDLDWIVMKALEKDRGRRYETAIGFAADIQSHLAYEPVQAAPPSQAYRLRKFVRKNRLPVFAASLVVLSLIGGVIGTSLGLIEARDKGETARKAEGIAKEKEGTANLALAKEAAARKELAANLAALSISTQFAADAAFADNRVAKANGLLEQIPLENRNMEWRLRKRRYSGGYATLYGHTGGVNTVAISPDGTRIASGSADKTIKIWDAITGMEIATLSGHQQTVIQVAFSPDGLQVASSSGDQAIKIWDVATGREKNTFMIKGTEACIAWSPDGTRIAIGSWDLKELNNAYVTILDVQSGAVLATFLNDGHLIYTLAYSPDGKQIVIGIEHNKLIILDTTQGLELTTLKGHFKESEVIFLGVAYSPDGKLIASSSYDTGSQDTSLKIWDVEKGTAKFTLQGFQSRINRVSFSPDGAKIASAFGDGTIKIWDATSGLEIMTLKGHNQTIGVHNSSDIYDAVFGPDGTKIVSCGKDNNIKVWDLNSSVDNILSNGHNDKVKKIVFSPNGSTLACVSNHRTLKLRDSRTGEEQAVLRGHSAEFAHVRFSSDGKRIMSTSGENESRETKIWDATTGAELHNLTVSGSEVDGNVLSPDGNWVVCWVEAFATISDLASSKQSTHLWYESKLRNFKGLGPPGFTGFAFSRDNKLIMSRTGDRAINIWDTITGLKLTQLKGYAGQIYTFKFSPDASRVVGETADNSVIIWDTATGTIVAKITPGIVSFAFSPDGTRIVSGNFYSSRQSDKGISTNNSIKVWDTTTGNELGVLVGHTDKIDKVEFSPDGGRLLSISKDKTARIWELETCTERAIVNGFGTSGCASLSFSPNGSRIIGTPFASYFSNSAVIWDTMTGLELINLKGKLGSIKQIAYSSDGSRIAGLSSDNSVIIWDGSGDMEIDEKPDAEWLASKNPKHPTKNWWLHNDGENNRYSVIDLTLSKDELARRRVKAMFKPFEANEEYQKAKTPYAKAFWKSRFAFNMPNDAKHWEEFKNECSDPATWRLMVKTCDLVLQRGPALHADKYRSWAMEKVNPDLQKVLPVPLK